jgi:hypothetical protein
MVNNSTNIKTNNHLLPQIIEHKKKCRHMELEIQVLVFNQTIQFTFKYLYVHKDNS